MGINEIIYQSYSRESGEEPDSQIFTSQNELLKCIKDDYESKGFHYDEIICREQNPKEVSGWKKYMIFAFDKLQDKEYPLGYTNMSFEEMQKTKEELTITLTLDRSDIIHLVK